ncbi:MAG: peptidyl-alpha-hydroxyglycine alpha-amidating lyase family protein [Planctomycetota bacterium]|nr:peptidyl-alpha-hydroxyglycine alpha-amidating lyase family protein [Planctomycetota bacterium]
MSIMKSVTLCLATIVTTFIAAMPSIAQDAPNDAIDPTFVEYDVDATWPLRPEGISHTGGVAGIAVDADDNIWVLQRGDDPIQIYRPDGTFVRTWGKGMFIGPHQLRIDREGNVWVADFRAHVIQKFTPEGELLLTLGTREQSGEDESHFYRPTDMAITPAGDIFVTDGYGNRRVVHFDKTGKFIKTWGKYGTKPGEFVLPHSIVLDAKGRLFVADRNVGRIQVFEQSGKVLDVWSGFIMPWALTMTAEGDILVCGSSPHWWLRDGKYPEVKDQLLMQLTTEGKIKQLWTWPLGVRKSELAEGEELKPGETFGVHCIAEDSQGNIYIGDIYSERAQKLVPVKTRSAADKAALLGTK